MPEKLVSTLEEIDKNFEKNPPRRFAPHNDVFVENFIYDAENDNLQRLTGNIAA